ncbi:membrane protein [Coniella lustricola]|uniref:Membrane protein n=1 Tax=Coniella lustricola TaxID=2025994 RepID=A0A2T3A122_9PEZI|nr:membrane protein [Coniella lustricola]
MSASNTLRGSSSFRGTSFTSNASGLSTPSPSGTTRGPTWKHHDFYAPRGLKHLHSFEPDFDEYWEGPRDIRQFSRVPLCLRLYGSVLPKIIAPLVFVGVWAAAITTVCEKVMDLGINSILLTVLGFIVGLALSFRFSTAYERYSDGSKYWTALLLHSRVLARTLWIFARERHAESEELGKKDLLGKLSAINLLNAFAVSLKHRQRFEPATMYLDLAPLVVHLDTMAGRANQALLVRKPKSRWFYAAEYLGLPLTVEDPREVLDNATENLGNLPLEILTYLSTYIKHIIQEGTLDGLHQGSAMNCITNLSEIQAGLERISDTPIPIAYSIAIAQVTWVYILLLPLQLWNFLGWLTIPGTLFAAYIVLSFERIGREIEDPFGTDVNDLPLEQYCRDLSADLDVLTRSPAPDVSEWMHASTNKVLYPLSLTGFDAWTDRSVAEIREALRVKASTRATTRMNTVRPNEGTPLLQEEV